MVGTVLEQVFLHCQVDNHDKVYVSRVIEGTAGTWIHYFAWGRRHGTLSEKKPAFSSYEEARQAHEAKVASQLDEYVIVPPDQAEALLGLRPLRLDPRIGGDDSRPAEAASPGPLDPAVPSRVPDPPGPALTTDPDRFLDDPAYFLQRRPAGEELRLCARGPADITLRSPSSGPLPPEQGEAVEAARLFEQLGHFDLLGYREDGSFIVTDLDGPDFEAWPAHRRMTFLLRLAGRGGLAGALRLAETALDDWGKASLLAEARSLGWDAVVFKHGDRPHFALSLEDLEHGFGDPPDPAGNAVAPEPADFILHLARKCVVQLGSGGADPGAMGMHARAGEEKRLCFLGPVVAGFAPGEAAALTAEVQGGRQVLAEIRYAHYDGTVLVDPVFSRLREDLDETATERPLLLRADGTEARL